MSKKNNSDETKLYIDAFKNEAEELLGKLEEDLLEMENNPSDQECLNKVFRAMHTIKGSGAMFGFDKIAGFTHHVETALDKVRTGSIGVNKQLIDLVLVSRDLISRMLHEPDQEQDSIIAENIIQKLTVLIEEAELTKTFNEEEKRKKADQSASMDKPSGYWINIFLIKYRPMEDVFSSGMDPAIILDEIKELGTAQITADTTNLPDIEDMDPEKSYFEWQINLETKASLEEIENIFIFQDKSEYIIETLDSVFYELPETDEYTLSSEQDLSISDDTLMTGRRDINRSRYQSSVRIPSDKLDYLINLVGELVITQARLSQAALENDTPAMTKTVEGIERLTEELRDCVLNIRMLPIGTSFNKFKRLVRDLSDELGKKIDLNTSGADTELDKTVLDRLEDPMVHLIRNSIDHGIESPAERMENNKPETGEIFLGAAHKGGSVVITIRDNGRGIDIDKLVLKAIEKEIIDNADNMTEQEKLNLIFHPGFSTSSSVTNVSGRGVGMDVVKKEIENLRGSIDIKNIPGHGMTINLMLPLTLAIIEGLLIRVGENRFVIPMDVIDECVELIPDPNESTRGRKLTSVRGEMLPYVRLRHFFNIKTAVPAIEHLVIVKSTNSRVGIVVDKIIGNHQTVIKSLGKIYQNVEGISGGTILGDGGIALIIDVPKVIRCAEQEI
ncbi:MAG: chemotaxis protein CheA [Deltaproteobacteria bacterium]|nr:chemotaxis protein CheA [Deltaproteobacteria bacterium]